MLKPSLKDRKFLRLLDDSPESAACALKIASSMVEKQFSFLHLISQSY